MGGNTQESEYSLFAFLRYLPIPNLLRKPIPALAILDTKLDLTVGSVSNSVPKSSRMQSRKKQRRTPSPVSLKKNTAGTILCSGEVRAGNGAPFAVGEENFTITEATWIFGEVKMGSIVQLTGVRRHDGTLEATKIIVS